MSSRVTYPVRGKMAPNDLLSSLSEAGGFPVDLPTTIKFLAFVCSLVKLFS